MYTFAPPQFFCIGCVLAPSRWLPRMLRHHVSIEDGGGGMGSPFTPPGTTSKYSGGNFVGAEHSGQRPPRPHFRLSAYINSVILTVGVLGCIIAACSWYASSSAHSELRAIKASQHEQTLSIANLATLIKQSSSSSVEAREQITKRLVADVQTEMRTIKETQSKMHSSLQEIQGSLTTTADTHYTHLADGFGSIKKKIGQEMQELAAGINQAQEKLDTLNRKAPQHVQTADSKAGSTSGAVSAETPNPKHVDDFVTVVFRYNSTLLPANHAILCKFG